MWTIFFLIQAESICHSLNVLGCGFKSQILFREAHSVLMGLWAPHIGITHLDISRDFWNFYPCKLERIACQRGSLSRNKSFHGPLNPALCGHPHSRVGLSGKFALLLRHLLWMVALKVAVSRPAPKTSFPKTSFQLETPESLRPGYWHISCWPDGLRTRPFPGTLFLHFLFLGLAATRDLTESGGLIMVGSVFQVCTYPGTGIVSNRTTQALFLGSTQTCLPALGIGYKSYLVPGFWMIPKALKAMGQKCRAPRTHYHAVW